MLFASLFCGFPVNSSYVPRTPPCCRFRGAYTVSHGTRAPLVDQMSDSSCPRCTIVIDTDESGVGLAKSAPVMLRMTATLLLLLLWPLLLSQSQGTWWHKHDPPFASLMLTASQLIPTSKIPSKNAISIFKATPALALAPSISSTKSYSLILCLGIALFPSRSQSSCKQTLGDFQAAMTIVGNMLTYGTYK